MDKELVKKMAGKECKDAGNLESPEILEEIDVEELSIDGICGVY